jgi:hypothetical protein
MGAYWRVHVRATLLGQASGLDVKSTGTVATAALWEGEMVTHCYSDPIMTHTLFNIIWFSVLDQNHWAICWEQPGAMNTDSTSLEYNTV